MKSIKRIRARTRDNAFTYRMPAGIPGTISRSAEQSTVDTVQLTANSFTAYGLGGLIDATTGKFRVPTTGDTAITGILVRPFPTISSQDALGTSTPPTSGLADRLLRGFISVKLGGAAAAKKDGAVYCRISAAAAGKPIGGFEAAADGSDTIAVTGARFTGPADADGITEIAFNI